MTLYCSACYFIEGKGDTEADVVIAGYSLCEDHAGWVRDELSRARAITEGNAAADPQGGADG